MKKQAGFTLVELMVVIAILGALAATSVGFLTKYRERTVGSEATVMMKQLLEAEIIYFLAHDDFFPTNGEMWVWNNGVDPSAANQQAILGALKVSISIGHLLDFRVYRTAAGSPVMVEIYSAGNFNLFPGVAQIKGTVDKTGKITGPTPF